MSTTTTATTVNEEPPAGTDHLGMFRALAPRLPSMLYKSALHTLSLTPQARYWDLRTTLTVDLLRSFLNRGSGKPTTVEQVQALTTRPTKVAANTWVARVRVDGPADAVEAAAMVDAVVAAVEAAGGSREHVQDAAKAAEVPLTAEWVGSRAKRHAVGKEKEMYTMSEQQRYDALLSEVDGGEEAGVVLWLHGGAYFVCDPHSHRPAARKLAKEMRGRVFMLRYRLAPQHPFPAALLDALTAYLNLLYPPATTGSAMHAPVPASRITLVGDSAGGGLAFALTQLLLSFARTGITLPWHGQRVSVPLPAGVGLLSPWVDVTRCFGGFGSSPNWPNSEESCAVYDYLPTPQAAIRTAYLDSPGWNAEARKTRRQFYAPDALLSHPFVSPLAAPDWTGAPPIFVCCGDELLRDSNRFLVHRLVSHGVKTQFLKYTAMPHVFPAIAHSPAASHAWTALALWVKHVTGKQPLEEEEEEEEESRKVMWGAREVHPVTLKTRDMGEEELSMGLEMDQVVDMMRRAVDCWGQEEGKEGRDVAGAVESASGLASKM